MSSHLAMAEERIRSLQSTIIQRDAQIQRLEKLSVDLREEYLHLKRVVRAAHDLLSGEFYAEALGELDDALNAAPQKGVDHAD